MLAEAMMLGKVTGPNPSRKLARQPDLVKTLGLYRDKVLALVDLGNWVRSPAPEKTFLKRLSSCRKNMACLVNDSVILAIALRLKADVLVSADAAFQKVTELKVAMPSDIH